MRQDTSRRETNALGDLLRFWRKKRSRSQLDLSLDSGVSQKHISFVESGRSSPSRQMILELAKALEIPLRERNELLLAAGYAPVYGESDWEDMDIRPLRNALRRVLTKHEPHPAVVMDRYWNILMTNDAAPAFFSRFVDLSIREGPRNILHLMCDPKGMRPFIENWDHVVSGLFQRIRNESAGRVLDARTEELMAKLKSYPDVEDVLSRSFVLDASPIIPVHFRKGDFESRYFSLVTTLGLPGNVTAQEFRIECMFPFDEVAPG